jgi:hypothetical protein
VDEDHKPQVQEVLQLVLDQDRQKVYLQTEVTGPKKGIQVDCPCYIEIHFGDKHHHFLEHCIQGEEVFVVEQVAFEDVGCRVFGVTLYNTIVIGQYILFKKIHMRTFQPT